jgi:site-specific DNA-methyltransferase (adenine-specific)
MKLFNDDCLKVLPTIPDNSIDLVLTDPPYGMNYQSGRRKIKHQ